MQPNLCQNGFSQANQVEMIPKLFWYMFFCVILDVSEMPSLRKHDDHGDDHPRKPHFGPQRGTLVHRGYSVVDGYPAWTRKLTSIWKFYTQMIRLNQSRNNC